MDEKSTEDHDDETIDVCCKWMKNKYELKLPKTATIGAVKRSLSSLTNVLPKRMKLLGMKMREKSTKLTDTVVLSQIGTTKDNNVRFVMVGTPEANLFVDLADGEGSDDIIDDLDYDYSAKSNGNIIDVYANKLNEYYAKLKITLMNEPRPNKKLLVLDIDYTIFDMKSRAETFNQLKRPFTDMLMIEAYKYFDIVFWSQTSWKWLEIKLTEMGILTHSQYKVLFVLDKTCMFKIESNGSSRKREHHVKPLELIWRSFPQYDATNTIHIDDLSRNFALNPKNGLKIKPYKNAHIACESDKELLYLTRYLTLIAENSNNFTQLNHSIWKQYLQQFGTT